MKAAFFDVDGTLTQNRVWNGIFEYFTIHRKRLLTHYYFLFIHYGLYLLFKVGLINQVQFRSPWARHLSWYFKGFTREGNYTGTLTYRGSETVIREYDLEIMNLFL